MKKLSATTEEVVKDPFGVGGELVVRKVPRYAYAVVLCIAFLALALFFLTLFRFEIRGSYPIVLALGICSILSAMIAFVWPGGSWRWGIWVSSGFWLYFGFVFVSFLLNRQLEWPPIIEAIAVALLGCAGGIVGRWFSGRIRGNAAAR